MIMVVHSSKTHSQTVMKHNMISMLTVMVASVCQEVLQD